MAVLFALTLFIGAALIFLVQPMVAKMVLPLYGGSPAVWNTCVVFFQAGLLGGYAYAHIGPKYLGLKRHAIVHLLLMVVPFFVLPIVVTEAWAPREGVPPALWLLAMLVAGAGLPFFLVSATTPLVQKWFAATNHPSAKDPYYLFAASNLGSMLALLSYPILLEPIFQLNFQGEIWRGGYVLLLVLLVACVAVLWRMPIAAAPEIPAETPKKKRKDQPAGLNWKKRLLWMALAFVPSSLMLSVTTYLTTDIAAIPLLWVAPLALYLLTFILTFTRNPPIPLAVMQRIMPLIVLLLVIVILSEAKSPIELLIFLHLLGLVVIGLVCHGRLAQARPSTDYLTEYYLWLAAGGVLGGIFNALLAPVLFMKTGVTEYPIVLVMACMLREPVSFAAGKKSRFVGFLRQDLLPAAILTLLAVALVFIVSPIVTLKGPIRIGIVFGLPAVICYTLLDRPLRYGLAIGGLFLAGIFYVGDYGKTIEITRSFFGVHRVTLSEDGKFRNLVHGSTQHGQQYLSPWRRHEPLTYYHTDSPIGYLFRRWHYQPAQPEARAVAFVGSAAAPGGAFFIATATDVVPVETPLPPLRDVAVVGLGVGSLAAYARPGQHWTFYEIDPTVKRLAENSEYFTYLRDARERLKENGSLKIVIGDARLQLKKANDRQYDLLIVDGFTSDAVPVHLLTAEAVRLYRQRLKKTGILAFHVSNLYLDLEPVLARVATDENLLCYSWFDNTDYHTDPGKTNSHWVIMGTKESPIRELAGLGLWNQLQITNSQGVWTDQYSDLLRVFKWGHWRR